MEQGIIAILANLTGDEISKQVYAKEISILFNILEEIRKERPSLTHTQN